MTKAEKTRVNSLGNWTGRDLFDKPVTSVPLHQKTANFQLDFIAEIARQYLARGRASRVKELKESMCHRVLRDTSLPWQRGSHGEGAASVKLQTQLDSSGKKTEKKKSHKRYEGSFSKMGKLGTKPPPPKQTDQNTR